MRISTVQTSPFFIASVAGFLYLLTVPLGVFTFLYVRYSLLMSGDVATTASNIMASESLFRPGLVSDLLASLVLILAVLVLYK